ncbi:MAG: acylphosphatase [Halanaerobiales bacterium]|nr:acylphosphatase [Halanaerobiales bacterium]
MDDKTRKHIYVSGRVQGVGFRASTQQKAQMIGVTGWVKNLKDGRVEVVIEGSKKKVQKMLDYLNKGPRFANVNSLNISDQKPSDHYNRFSIKY